MVQIWLLLLTGKHTWNCRVQTQNTWVQIPLLPLLISLVLGSYFLLSGTYYRALIRINSVAPYLTFCGFNCSFQFRFDLPLTYTFPACLQRSVLTTKGDAKMRDPVPGFHRMLKRDLVWKAFQKASFTVSMGHCGLCWVTRQGHEFLWWSPLVTWKLPTVKHY